MKTHPFTMELHKQHPDWVVKNSIGEQVKIFDVHHFGVNDDYRYLAVHKNGAAGTYSVENVGNFLSIAEPDPVRIVRWIELAPTTYSKNYFVLTHFSKILSRHPLVRVVFEQQPDGAWIVLGTKEQADIE